MVTAIINWRVAHGIDRKTLIDRFTKSVPVYKGRTGLVRKYICLDLENSRGCGIYLWQTRQQAETFFAMARPMIREETGSDPVMTLYETPIVVDNLTGETLICDRPA